MTCRKNKQRKPFFSYTPFFFFLFMALEVYCSKYHLMLSSLLTRVLTGDDAGDFGQKALDSADRNSTCFVILHSRNDVFNLPKRRRGLVIYAKW